MAQAGMLAALAALALIGLCGAGELAVRYDDCQVIHQRQAAGKLQASFRYQLMGNCWLTSQRKNTTLYGLQYSQATVTVRVPSGGCLAPYADVDAKGCIRYDIRRHPVVPDAYIETSVDEAACPSSDADLRPLVADVVQRDGDLCKDGERLIAAVHLIDDRGDAQVWDRDFMLLGHAEVRDACYARNCVFDRADGLEVEGVWNRSNRAVEFRVLVHRGQDRIINGSYVLIKTLGNHSIYGNKDTGNADNLFNDLAANWPYEEVDGIAMSLARLPDGRASVINQCSIVTNGSCVVLKAVDAREAGEAGVADCVAERYLLKSGLKCRYHERSRLARVWCKGEVCVTGNHVVVWNGRPTPMWKLCANTRCTSRMELVNQPCVAEWVRRHGALYDGNGVSVLSGGDVLSRVLATHLLLVRIAGAAVRVAMVLLQTGPMLGFGVLAVTMASRRRRC